MAPPRPRSAVSRCALFLSLSLTACTGAISGDTEVPAPVKDPAGEPRPTPSPGKTGGAPGSSIAPPPGSGGLIDGTMPKGGATGETCSSTPPVTPRLVRLTRTQYENSLRDLTGLDVKVARDLPPDPEFAGYNRGLVLEVGEIVSRVYRDTAESVARQLVASPAALLKTTGCDPKGGDACAATFIADFGKRAFRRGLDDAEKARYRALFAKAPTLVEGGDAFANGARVVVEAMLQSPLFLYRHELSTKREGALVALSSYEVAARLSYTLTNSMPDPMLFAAAEKGELTNPDAVAAHARRLLATPQGKATLRDFHAQWMESEHWLPKLTKDTKVFTGFSPSIHSTLTREMDMFVESIAERGGGLTSLFTAAHTFVTSKTAPWYGLTGMFGSDLQEAKLDPTQRAGILTQLGFLASHAFSDKGSPIHRGTFVQRNVLCTPIPPPQEQVPKLPPPAAGKTNREVVQEHTSGAGCAGCHHTLINPVGFAFENYDAIGQWRTMDNGKPVDASGSLVGTMANTKFDGPVAAMKAIAASPEARACYARQLWRYAYGRDETEGDSCAIKALAEALASDTYTARDLFVDMVRTKAFMFRAPEAQ